MFGSGRVGSRRGQESFGEGCVVFDERQGFGVSMVRGWRQVMSNLG